MSNASPVILQRYRQPVWGQMDRALRNCFAGAAILGVVILVGVFVVPAPPPEPIALTDVPERLARLILEPKPVAPTFTPQPAPVIEAPPVETPVEPVVAKPKPKPRRRTSPPKAKPDAGSKGREMAQQQVAQNVEQVTGSLDKVLDNLSAALPASEKSGEDKPKPRRRRRGVRSGRGSQQVASVQGVNDLAPADVSGSAIESKGIHIAAITDLIDVPDPGTPAGATATGVGGSRASGGELRSNESLLSVVRRYAPGIQFCYDNELKKNPGLRGKLSINITVLADGTVSDVLVVEDTLRSDAVKNCVLSQIRGWQFPAIPQGTTSFKTPFVFTPPD